MINYFNKSLSYRGEICEVPVLQDLYFNSRWNTALVKLTSVSQDMAWMHGKISLFYLPGSRVLKPTVSQNHSADLPRNWELPTITLFSFISQTEETWHWRLRKIGSSILLQTSAARISSELAFLCSTHHTKILESHWASISLKKQIHASDGILKQGWLVYITHSKDFFIWH